MCEHHDHHAPEAAGDPFHVFVHETPAHADAWLELTHRLEHATSLDPLPYRLAAVAVTAALGHHGALPFHVELAREAGATREAIASAVLVGLPAAGDHVIEGLPIALAAFDGATESAAVPTL